MESDALVRDYLARLEAAAARLPAGRRAELVGEIREHIDVAVAEAGTSNEVAVRNVLDRLGSPEDIVSAESGRGGAPLDAAMTGPNPAATVARPPIGLLEVVALLLVTVGVFVAPIIGPAVGIGLIWLSRALSTRQKLLVTALVVALVVLPIIALMSVGAGSGTIEGP